MNCDWEVIETNEYGWRMVRCKRPQCGIKGGWTPHELDNIQSPCRGWPYRHEWRLWLSFVLSALIFVPPARLRDIAGKLAPKVADVSDLGDGPGSGLTILFAAVGILGCCDCRDKAKLMNEWGDDGCRARREEIIGWLRAKVVSREDWLCAAALAFKSGLAFRLNWLDPLPSLVDEAIRRSELKHVQCKRCAV